MTRASIIALALAGLLVTPAAAQSAMDAAQIEAALARQASKQGCSADCLYVDAGRGGRIILDDAEASVVTGATETEVARRAPAVGEVPAFRVSTDLPPAVAREDEIAIRVTFETNSAYIRPSAADELAAACQVFSRLTSQARLNVIGHTDASGESGYNRALSGARANAVARYFVGECGLERGQLVVFGAGEERLLPGVEPVSEANRRVEVSLAPFS